MIPAESASEVQGLVSTAIRLLGDLVTMLVASWPGHTSGRTLKMQRMAMQVLFDLTPLEMEIFDGVRPLLRGPSQCKASNDGA